MSKNISVEEVREVFKGKQEYATLHPYFMTEILNGDFKRPEVIHKTVVDSKTLDLDFKENDVGGRTLDELCDSFKSTVVKTLTDNQIPIQNVVSCNIADANSYLWEYTELYVQYTREATEYEIEDNHKSIAEFDKHQAVAEKVLGDIKNYREKLISDANAEIDRKVAELLAMRK